MQTWGWLLVYVVGFGLVQLLLYRHFVGRETTPRSGDRSGSAFGALSEDGSEDGATAGLRCRHCGTENEASQMVRYCRACVEPLQ